MILQVDIVLDDRTVEVLDRLVETMEANGRAMGQKTKWNRDRVLAVAALRGLERMDVDHNPKLALT